MKIVSLGTLFDSRKHKTLVPATRQKVDEGPIALAQFLGSSCGQRKHIQVTFFRFYLCLLLSTVFKCRLQIFDWGYRTVGILSLSLYPGEWKLELWQNCYVKKEKRAQKNKSRQEPRKEGQRSSGSNVTRWGKICSDTHWSKRRYVITCSSSRSRTWKGLLHNLVCSWKQRSSQAFLRCEKLFSYSFCYLC